MWFYGYFTNGYNVNSTEVCEEIDDNSDNSDVIVLLKTEHIYLFQETHKEKAPQKLNSSAC